MTTLIEFISSLSLVLIGFFAGSMYEMRRNLSLRIKSITIVTSCPSCNGKKVVQKEIGTPLVSCRECTK